MLKHKSPWLLLATSLIIFHSWAIAADAAQGNPFESITPSNVLEWKPCYGGKTKKIDQISCARLVAPLDYANASSGSVQLAIIKIAGSDGTNATSPVFYNPGGPGDDPVEALLSNIAAVRARIGTTPDIIAVVPRGVGSTTPLMTCDATSEIATHRLWEMQDTLPGETEASSAESYAIGQSLGLDCNLVTPKLTPYIGTVFAAHDIDYVRHALGLSTLSYLGDSYGTVLGGTYAVLFPDRVQRMVLDGVLDLNNYYSPNKNPELDIGDADSALANFFASCLHAGPHHCVLWSKTIEQIEKRFMEADQQVFQRPIPVPRYGLLKWPLWRSGVYNALYRPSEGFPLLAGAAAEILEGTAGPYIEAYMKIVQGSLSSTQDWLTDPRTGLKNSPNAGNIISCSDSGADRGFPTTQQLDDVFARYEKVSRFFGGVSSQYVFICMGAKLKAKERVIEPVRNISTAYPILFVGNTVDPTTPIAGAFRMSDVFNGSRVLTINGTGHLSFNAAQDSHCATEWIAPYFLDGSLPPKGTVCDGRQQLFASGV